MERKSAFVVAGVVLALAALTAWRGHVARAEVMAVLAVLLALAAALSARFEHMFHVTWMGLAHRLGAVNTVVVLTLVYALGFVPYRWFGRAFGRDPLGRREAPKASYWTARARTRQQPWQFERLY